MLLLCLVFDCVDGGCGAPFWMVVIVFGKLPAFIYIKHYEVKCVKCAIVKNVLK